MISSMQDLVKEKCSKLTGENVEKMLQTFSLNLFFKKDEVNARNAVKIAGNDSGF